MRSVSRTNIEHAAALTYELRWRHLRSAPQYQGYVDGLLAFFQARGIATLDEITTLDLAAFIRSEEAKGHRVVMRHKLSALRMIVKTAMEMEPRLATRPLAKVSLSRPHVLKWWLRPEDREDLIAWLRAEGKEEVANYVLLVAYTGVRVEEALRFSPSCFEGLTLGRPRMTVPGLKTAGAQKTLPMYAQAAEIVSRLVVGKDPGEPLFRLGEPEGTRALNEEALDRRYRKLWFAWQECREHLGVLDVPTSTLKNLRRSFGRIATEKGMPTEVLRDYYRHSDIATTAGYLKLVGGYSEDTIRQWVD